MLSKRLIKLTHTILFSLVFLASVAALGVSSAIVKHYNSRGYPPVNNHGYRDRIRILLVASVWTTASAKGIGDTMANVWSSVILMIGFLAAGENNAVFGLLTHIILVTIAFLLFLIGVSSLTALTDKISCSKSGQGFEWCNVVKGLVAISWIDTIFIFITLVFLIVLACMARRRYGASRSTLYLD
nr:hypothetical protein L204_00122 [Cryptococcus depauperatus CBS 7855]